MRLISKDWVENFTVAFVVVLGMFGASSVQAAEEDPWEGVNRAIFTFNDKVDTYTLKPLAQGYQKITPNVVEDGIGNIFSNLGDVVVLINDLLQDKVRDAGIDTSRILFISTFGVLGLFDVATRMGLQKNDEDFGQTLAPGGWAVGRMWCCPCWGRAPCAMRQDAYPIRCCSHIRTWTMCRHAM